MSIKDSMETIGQPQKQVENMSPEEKERVLEERKIEVVKLIEKGNLREARRIINEQNEGDEKWRERLQRKITAYWYERVGTDRENARAAILEIIGETFDKLSQEGRIAKFEKIFGEKYNGPRSENMKVENPKTLSDHFKNALYEKDYKRTEELLVEIREKETEEKIGHREHELIKAYGENGDFTAAQKVINTMILTENNKKSQIERQEELNKKRVDSK